MNDYGETIKRAKNGDSVALSELYETYYPHIAFACNNLCDSKEDLEEIVQDAFVTAFSKLDQLNNEATFLPWLRKIAVNMCYRKYDKNKNDREHLVYLEDMSHFEAEELNKDFLPMECINDAELRKEILDIIEALPVVQKKMVYLYYYVGINSTEIAKLHACTAGYVRSSLGAAKKSMKEKAQKMKIGGAAIGGSLGALIIAEEAAFAASYSAANTALIASNATSVVETVAGKAVTSKIAGYVSTAACIAVAGLIALVVYYNIAQQADYQEADTENLDLAVTSEQEYEVEEYSELPYAQENLTYDELYEEAHYETEVNVAENIEPSVPYSPYSQNNYQDDNYNLAQIPYEQQEQEPEPELMLDRTAAILAALNAAQTENCVATIIREYGFVLFVRAQGVHGDSFRFYFTNEGSGDILIGTRTYETEWNMRFRFFESGVITMQQPELIHWVKSQ